jgi:hypothetical protein
VRVELAAAVEFFQEANFVRNRAACSNLTTLWPRVPFRPGSASSRRALQRINRSMSLRYVAADPQVAEPCTA